METDKAAETDVPDAAGVQASLGRNHLQAQIAALLRDQPTQDEFFQRFLQFCRETFRATLVRLDVVRDQQAETLVSHDDRMPRRLAQRFTTEYLTPFVKELHSESQPETRLKRYERGDQKMTLAGVPLVKLSDEKTPVTLSLMIGGTVRADMLLVRLDAVAAVASTVLMTQYRTSTENPIETESSATEPSDGSANAAAADHQAVVRAARFQSVKEFAYSVVNSLRSELSAEQVFLGQAKKRRIVVEAVSGVADFKASSPGVVLARQAMEECLDAGEPLLYPQTTESGRSVPAIHRQWSGQTAGAAICSLPLLDGDEVAGVISLRRSAGQPFRQEEVDRLQKVLAPYGAALRVIDQVRQSTAQRLKSSVQSTLSQNLRSGARGRKVLLGVLAAALLWFCFGSMTYRPICPVRVTATDLRHLSAPMTARLAALHVKPGQQVAAGELLAELEVSDLQLEYNSLRRQFLAAQTDIRRALAEDDPGSAAVTRSQMQVLEAQMSALQKQMTDARIVAPQDGTVVLSGLETRIGQTVSQGDELMQFAGESDWCLEIQVPDDIAPLVSRGQTGHFSASARPTERQTFVIQEVDGAASVVADRNVFIAHAHLSSRPDWMKIGMEGTVRISTVSRPVWWVAMHRVVDWVRLNFWL